MKALIIIACCFALAFVLSAMERLRVFISRDKIKLDDPENLTDSRASRYPVNIRTRSQSSCKTVCNESFQRLIYYSASPGHR